jgi:hypothetical protein
MELVRKVILSMVALGGSVASAVPITYTFTGTATGTIGGTSFSNATLTISVTLDTSNVTSPSSGHFQSLYAANTAMFSISGVGSGTLSSAGGIYLNPPFGGIINLYDNGTAGQLVEVDDNSIGSAALASYALATAIGPLGPQAVDGGAINNVATSRGSLTLTSFEINVAFQATTSAAPVPVPPSLYLCLAGLAAASVYTVARRRRHRYQTLG